MTGQGTFREQPEPGESPAPPATRDALRRRERDHGVRLPGELAEAFIVRDGGPVRGTVALELASLSRFESLDDARWDHIDREEGSLDRLAALFPDFAAYWDDPGNCFRRDDGSFTLHGVSCRFTDDFRERYDAVPADRVAVLGAFISECLASSDPDLDNAAATCFVEDNAGEPCDRDLARHFTGKA